MSPSTSQITLIMHKKTETIHQSQSKRRGTKAAGLTVSPPESWSSDMGKRYLDVRLLRPTILIMPPPPPPGRDIEKQQRTTRREEEEGKGLILPPEIWGEIGKRIQSRLGILRFRSACRTFRSSLPPPSRFPLRVPAPPVPNQYLNEPESYFITEITFYALNQRIVVFEEEHRGGKFSASVYLPKTHLHKCKFSLPQFNQISSSRLSFLCNAHHLHNAYPRTHQGKRVEGKYDFVANYDVLKNVIISRSNSSLNPNYADADELTLVIHMYTWELAVLRLGDGRGDPMKNNWETGFCSTKFDDMVNYRGQLYAVDRLGRAFVMDYNSLQMTQVSDALPDYRRRRHIKILHLAVHSGGLYLLLHEYETVSNPKVYKLRIRQWVEVVEEEDDQVFYVKDAHCNFVVSRDLFRTRRHSNKYEMPRICSWPEFVFVQLAVGFKNTYEPPLRFRDCDLHWIPYHHRR